MMHEKIGVFICDCGDNISGSLDIKKLAEFAGTQEEVTAVKMHGLWCSEEGREKIRKAITENGLTRIVVAACSPKQHEKTFQKTLAASGINPFLLQMANIREQVAWVTPDREQATQKSIALLNSAIKRVKQNQPVIKPEIDANTDFLVIGAGIAGLSAALTLSQKGRKVYVVERGPWLGGKTAAFEEVFPRLECAPCMIEPLLSQVLENERIQIFTNSEVENVKGFFGNFEITIRQKPRFINDKCIGCSACYDACPVKIKNKYDGNLSDRHAVYVPYPGALPNIPVIDMESCLRGKGEECDKCYVACGFGAVDYGQKDAIINVKVGAIIAATGFEQNNIKGMVNFSANSPDALDSYQFERLLSATGPTGGKVLRKNNRTPSAIVFIHCAGSRDKRHVEYCSGICCANSVKQAHLARKKLGDAVQIYEFYSDWCAGGRGYQEFINRSSAGIKQIRVNNTNDIRIEPDAQGFTVDYGGMIVNADMLVFALAITSDPGAAKVASILGISLDKDGFFVPEHEKLNPEQTALKGIFIAGCATGPKDISQSVMQGKAAAGAALSSLVPGEKIETEAATAFVDETKCCGCMTCVKLCPYQAISFHPEKKVSKVNEVLCRGCGTCVAACPAEAILNRNFSVDQIFSEIEGVLL
jgi:heterodisulfide reductase subunit A